MRHPAGCRRATRPSQQLLLESISSTVEGRGAWIKRRRPGRDSGLRDIMRKAVACSRWAERRASTRTPSRYESAPGRRLTIVRVRATPPH